MIKRKLLAMFFMGAAVLAAGGCSSDDDSRGGGSSGSGDGNGVHVSVGGVDATLGHVYWLAESGADGENFYEVEFFSYDFYGIIQSGDYSRLPSLFSSVYISFMAPGSLSELPVCTIPAGDYEVSGGLNCSRVNPEGECYVEEGPSSGSLVISRSGDNYTVTISRLELIYSAPESVGAGNWQSATTQWHYSGAIRKAPSIDR